MASSLLSRTPQLLVSVRNPEEAVLALREGVDILDVKDPAQGSLGRAAPDVLSDIIASINNSPRKVPLSIALGECCDLSNTGNLAIPFEVSYVKMGLAFLANSQFSCDWMAARTAIEQASGRSLNWVAVAYADAAFCQAPPWQEVLRAAVETKCAAFLIDTWSKSSGRLGDWLTPHNISEILAQAHKVNLPVALAGRLTLDSLADLMHLNPSVIAVRSAVCNSGVRESPLCPERLRKAIAAVRSARPSSGIC